MSGIYIHGMEMPKEGTVFVIDSTGQVWSNEWPTRGYTRLDGVKAIPVPPHGDLIDASAKVTVQTYDDMYEEYRDEECTIADALDRWSNEGCPEAIIPAEKGET